MTAAAHWPEGGSSGWTSVERCWLANVLLRRGKRASGNGSPLDG